MRLLYEELILKITVLCVSTTAVFRFVLFISSPFYCKFMLFWVIFTDWRDRNDEERKICSRVDSVFVSFIFHEGLYHL